MQLRDNELIQSKRGVSFVELINQHAEALGRLLLEDEATRRLANDALGRWLRMESNEEVLAATITDEDAVLLKRLVEHVGMALPDQAAPMHVMSEHFSRCSGRSIAEMLNT